MHQYLKYVFAAAVGTGTTVLFKKSSNLPSKNDKSAQNIASGKPPGI